jgi:hypothetical protein
MTRSLATRIPARIASAVIATAAAGTLALAGAGTANAGLPVSKYLSPNGGQVCTASQYAGFAVRAEGSATGPEGAKFKLHRNGQVVANTPTRQPSFLIERRTVFGNFDGPGNYQLCAVNTGDSPTSATVRLSTDSELGRTLTAQPTGFAAPVQQVAGYGIGG